MRTIRIRAAIPGLVPQEAPRNLKGREDRQQQMARIPIFKNPHMPRTERVALSNRSGVCYALDGEVGNDAGALGNGDHRTRLDHLFAGDLSGQPASLSA
jgi:hypothetical protein